MSEKKDAIQAKNETVVIKIPRERKDQDDMVVWINDKKYTIKRGVAVEVPISVAKVLEKRDKMLERAYEYDDAHASRT